MIGCDAVCGRLPSSSHAPWFATIFSSEGDYFGKYYTLGVIVSDRIILSYGQTYHGILRGDISLTHAYAGRMSYRKQDFEGQPSVQVRSITERMVLHNPIDASDQTLAVFIVDKPFDFNLDHVAPVCLEWPASVSRINNGAPIGETGLVAAPVFETTNSTQVYYKILDSSECKWNDERANGYGHTDFDKDLNRGKMCARRPENAYGDNCAMTQGNGFVIPKIENGERIYYLKGIASGSFLPVKTNCNKDDYQLFININFFKDPIQTLIKKYRANTEEIVSSSTSCTISLLPEDGFASVPGNVTVRLDVGNEVNHMASIEYSCDSGYYLIGGDSNTCTNGLWNRKVPRCEPSSLQGKP